MSWNWKKINWPKKWTPGYPRRCSLCSSTVCSLGLGSYYISWLVGAYGFDYSALAGIVAGSSAPEAGHRPIHSGHARSRTPRRCRDSHQLTAADWTPSPNLRAVRSIHPHNGDDVSQIQVPRCGLSEIRKVRPAAGAFVTGIIEAAASGEAGDGNEFETVSFDVASAASTSDGPGVYRHSYGDAASRKWPGVPQHSFKSQWLTRRGATGSPIPARPLPDPRRRRRAEPREHEKPVRQRRLLELDLSPL